MSQPYSAARSVYFSARISWTSLSLPSISASKATGPASVRMPGKRCPSSALRRASAAASSALDGTQPVFTHVPPVVPRSTITTERPLRRAAIAAANAPPPEPMTARS